jgi:short-subunit dehydrogenase
MATVIITGASMGIGRSLALAWAERKATVVLSARGKDALDEVAGEVIAKGANAVVVPGDVTEEDHRLEIVERAIAETGRIDVLVNNAGRGFLAQAAKIDLAQMRELFELNVYAPLHLAQIAMPHLEKTRGTVVMMSSIAGVVSAPRYGAYAASKFALEALAMAMRSELATSGVKVVVIRPGPVATPFRVNAMRGEGEAYDAPVDPKAQAPETIALLTLRAVDRGTSIVETSAYVRFASAASRLAPPAVRVALRRMATKSAS